MDREYLELSRHQGILDEFLDDDLLWDDSLELDDPRFAKDDEPDSLLEL